MVVIRGVWVIVVQYCDVLDIYVYIIGVAANSGTTYYTYSGYFIGRGQGGRRAKGGGRILLDYTAFILVPKWYGFVYALRPSNGSK